MENRIPKDAIQQSVLDVVFADFIGRLRKDNTIDVAVSERVQKALQEKQYSLEKLKAALFSEDAL